MISIQNVSKNFGSLKVLENISVEIEQGDIFGIIGQSGAGKSTLLRCINGLETYDQGSITVDGREISSLSKKELQNVQKEMGMIFQNFNLLSRLNVYDNIALPLQFWKQKKNSPENQARIHELLKLVGLEDKIHSYPKQLSGGQKQRVAIARALVLNPKILLCDEATSALDPKITKDILDLLQKINKELGITIVVVTHQMEVVKQICNRVAFIKYGRNVATGKPEELFVAPNQEIQAFVGESVECLPSSGINIKLFFNSQDSESGVITKMARELNADFAICQGKLENFRGSILGSLVINVQPEDKIRVLAYLDEHQVLWEVIQNV
jgi:D-methionine transport system ATP-binding protein